MIETSSVLTRKSSVIFGHLRQSAEFSENVLNVCLAFGQLSENLQKSSESDEKSSASRQKSCHQYVNIINKITHGFF